MSDTKAYLYLEGLYELAGNLRGNERVFAGIRPYDLHAGNVLSIAAYPYLLCEEVRKRNIEPKFTFFVSINDWEQSEWVGEDIYTYPFDIYPKNSTIANTQFSKDTSLVNRWQPIIEKELIKVRRAFPGTTIQFVRNSALKKSALMKKALSTAILDRKKIKEMLLEITESKTLGKEMYFANALCSKCLDANTNTEIINGKFKTNCEKCGISELRSYADCDYWMHYKLLFPPRLAILNFEVAISGADHLMSGDFIARQKLYSHIYNKSMPSLKMLFAPLVLTDNDEKMSKSRNNHFYRPLETMIGIARNTHGSSVRLLT